MSNFFNAITRKAVGSPDAVTSVSRSHEICIDGVPYLSAGELAAHHGLCRDYIARLARHGKLRGRQFAGQWFIDETSFKNFLVLREYEHAARREQLAADRQREYRIAQAAASENPIPITTQKSPPPRNGLLATEEGGLRIRLSRLCISIRLDRAGAGAPASN
jgi:hypothetical protein